MQGGEAPCRKGELPSGNAPLSLAGRGRKIPWSFTRSERGIEAWVWRRGHERIERPGGRREPMRSIREMKRALRKGEPDARFSSGSYSFTAGCLRVFVRSVACLRFFQFCRARSSFDRPPPPSPRGSAGAHIPFPRRPREPRSIVSLAAFSRASSLSSPGLPEGTHAFLRSSGLRGVLERSASPIRERSSIRPSSPS